MKKGKIEIQTTVDGQTVSEKYICKVDDNTIIYTDKQKTTSTLTVGSEELNVKREGFVNYELMHDGKSKSSSPFNTLVEGQEFSMELIIQNKSLKINSDDSNHEIEISFEREDKCIVKQNIKVEAKWLF